MAVPDVQSSLDVAEVLAAQLEEVGIVVEIKPFPLDTFYATDVGRPVERHRRQLRPRPGDLDGRLADPGGLPGAPGRRPQHPGHRRQRQPRPAQPAGHQRAGRPGPRGRRHREADELWRQVAAEAAKTNSYVPLTETRVQLVAGQRLRNGLVMLPYSSYDLATAGVR